MLPFELSAIDLILVIAVIIILILYITKISTKAALEEKLLVGSEGQKAEKERLSQPPALKTSYKCPYDFGYLRKLGRDATIPDGCLGCPRIMDCYSADK